MSRNHNEIDFSQDYGRTVPINFDFFITPLVNRYKGLRTGVYTISTLDLNEREFCVDGGWHRMADYKFGAVEPKENQTLSR